jgi:hypothetical protein
MQLSKIGLSTVLLAVSMSFGALGAQAADVKTEARDIQSSKPNISGLVWNDEIQGCAVFDDEGYCLY